MNLKLAEDKILKEAIEELEDKQACAGCNDLEIPDTEESRQLLREAFAWNNNCSIEDIENHDDWNEEYEFKSYRKGTLLTSDSLMIYLLKKRCGLLTK